MNNVQLSEMSKKQSKHRGLYQVFLHNDNRNTFEHVIHSLSDVCGYNEMQSLQCALIVDSAGVCSICTDVYDECLFVYEYLQKVGLKVTMSKVKK